MLGKLLGNKYTLPSCHSLYLNETTPPSLILLVDLPTLNTCGVLTELNATPIILFVSVYLQYL